MKKLVVLSVMLAAVLGVTVPAMGVEGVSAVEDVCVVENTNAAALQAGLGNLDDSCTDNATTDQEFEQAHFDSGDIDSISEVNVAGDNNAVCAPSQSSNDTGNTGEQQGVSAPSNVDDIGFAGSESEENPSQLTECAPAVNQSAAS